MIRAGLALGLSLALAAPSFASDANQQFAVRGIGSTACADFVAKADGNAPDLVVYVAWADGAVSAANRYRDSVFEVAPFIDPPGVFANLVLNLCRANPQLMYDAALTRTIDLLRPAWVSVSQDLLTITIGEATVRLYPETLKAVQTKLIALGLLQGDADGAFGAKTQGAIAAYQASKGKPQSGLPDAETVLALLLTQ